MDNGRRRCVIVCARGGDDALYCACAEETRVEDTTLRNGPRKVLL